MRYNTCDAASAVGTYDFAVTINVAPDDHGDDAGSATPLVVNDPPTDGDLEVEGDSDWFSFTAMAGADYSIQATEGTLGDVSIELYDTDGTTRVTGAKDGFSWTCPDGAGGTYYLRIFTPSAMTGTYDIAVSTFGDDHGSIAEEATPLVVNDSPTAGNLEVIGDRDWFTFPAQEGITYTIAAEVDTVTDLDLHLYSTDSFTVYLEKDDDGGSGTIVWECPAGKSGTYYVRVTARLVTGTYDVGVTADLPEPDAGTDSGVVEDAGIVEDAGAGPEDAGTEEDIGGSSESCDCRAVGRPSGMLGLLSVLWMLIL